MVTTSLTSLVKVRDTECKVLNDWPDAYIEAIQNLDKSTFSEIVDADNGLHILRVTSIDHHKTTRDMAKLKDVIQERHLMLAVQKWTHTLYDQAYVKIYMTEPLSKWRFLHKVWPKLYRTYVIDKMITALALKDGDWLVEMGPGRGALTYPLLAYL